MRDIILYGNIEDNKDRILKYCEDDTKYLEPLLQILYKLIRGYDKTYRTEDVLQHARWMLDIAVIESNGIPIDVEKLKNFADNYASLSIDIPMQCNKVHPFFVYNQRKAKYTRNYDLFKQFVERSGMKWSLTPSGKYKQDMKTLDGLQTTFPEIRTYRNTISA